MQHVEIINDCLSKFCLSFGMKVNSSKTRVYFSDNIHNSRREEISSALGFVRTHDLGKYLGVPLHHQRVGQGTFHDIVDKVKRRLANWKASFFSLAGRTTLIASVTSAIPGYTMQTAYLPASTCNTIDKGNRNFLWGHTDDMRKTHLVAWNEVCKSKREGGLGLRHAAQQNQAYMMKLGWNLVQNHDSLRVRVMREKYKCGKDLVPKIEKKKTGSNVWAGIEATWDKTCNGIEIGNNGSDFRWKWERNGLFSVKSAYNKLTEDNGDHDSVWQKIWKVHATQRCRSFMWLAYHDRLLTNEAR